MRLLLTGASGFIGTNLVESLCKQRGELMNFDIQAPLNPEHAQYWKRGDIMNRAGLADVFAEFAPTHVVHMAARTECDENATVESGYAVNTVGTENVLGAVKSTPSVRRVVIVSTQYVAGPGRLPDGDEDFFPHTVYGESKVITEQLTRQAELKCTWTIVRPTNVWGPWHLRYAREAWKVIKKGLYLHPAGPRVVRSYAYVGNLVWQMEQILNAPDEKVDQEVFYLGDKPIEVLEWVDAFSVALRDKRVRRVPAWFLRVIGLAGDGLKCLGVKFPLTSPRVRSMTQDYLTPMDKTLQAFGQPPYTLQQGVAESVEWMDSYGR